MNAWREELQALLRRTETGRPPALRRSRRDGCLYATDLPQAGVPAAAADFCREAEKAGWSWEIIDGWIELSREAEAPPEGWFGGPFGPEAACCASLLERHGQGPAGTPEAKDEMRLWTAALVKAGEEGPRTHERACRQVHGAWAERLRQGKPIPGMSLRFFRKENGP